MKRLLFGVVLATLVSAVSVAAAPRNSTQSSIILNAPSGVNSLTGSAWEPSLGQAVSFTSTFPSSLDPSFVYVQVACYQNGLTVFRTSARYDRSVVLGDFASPWMATGGDAVCRADLYYFSSSSKLKINILASTEFDAQG